MASRISVNIFYVYDKCPTSLFKGIYVIKMANDKVEEIEFGLETRIENRNDIDMIVKEFSAVTVYIMEKDIILRLTDSGIKTINPKRSKGIAFEVVKGVMARLSIFDGVDATLYCPTKEIGVANDAALSSDVILPDFATLMTRDEIDVKFEERRRRKEERESGKFTTPMRNRTSVSNLSINSTRFTSTSSPIVNSNMNRREKEKALSNTIEDKINDMEIFDEDEDLELKDNEDEDEDEGGVAKLLIEISSYSNDSYEFSKSEVAEHSIEKLSAPYVTGGLYKHGSDKKNGNMMFKRVKGSGLCVDYHKILLTDGSKYLLAKAK
ncbi:uncharacterized protein LOC132922152 [Rhopalosiphum padi]|uniref:uncharacterized protein LOC132922152 n=1 Tax=Rhopalosiphum padi TaxID=40932 RepID=UPI00298E7C9D|nr:uncharacterized protein LOC132922152 [Rhopalosiphum padi]